MRTPAWSLRPATYDDGRLLGEIAMAAAKDQGLWPAITPAEEAEWLDGFAEWSRESVDGPDRLQLIEVDGVSMGRLRTERDRVTVNGHDVPRVQLCGIQLLPAYQRLGIGTAVIHLLQEEAASNDGVLELGVEQRNSGARRLYDRLGFVPIGQEGDEDIMRWTSARAAATTRASQSPQPHRR